MRARLALVALAAVVPCVATATGAQAALPPVSTFVVNTSFTGTSPILEADGVWTGCTEVIDVSASANQVSPTRLVRQPEHQRGRRDGEGYGPRLR